MDGKRSVKIIKLKYSLTEMALTCLLRLVKNLLKTKTTRSTELLIRKSRSKQTLVVRTVNKLRGIKPNTEVSSIAVAKYIQRLPVHLIDEVFQRYIRHEVGIEPHHLMAFIYDGQKRMKLNFRNENFDVLQFLNLFGFRMRNIEELQFPRGCFISLSHCQTLRVIAPRIKKLDLTRVDIGDESMLTIAQFPLEELSLNYTNISDEGLSELWDPNAKTLRKLRVLRIANSEVSFNGHIAAIKELPMLQDTDCSCALLFSIPRSIIMNNLRISVLKFDDTYTNIERALEVVATTIPTVTSISLTSDGYTPKMLTTLTYIKNLNRLSFKNGLFLYNFHLASCINNDFTVLREFTLCDYWNLWFDESDCQAFTIVAKCPKLQKLCFAFCDGLTNQIAGKMALLLRNSELKHLTLKYCSGIGTYGIVAFLRISTLARCEIFLANSKGCDVTFLQQAASQKNVKLKILSVL